MQSHTVADSTHSQLTYTEMHIAAASIILAEESLTLHLSLVGWSQVSTTTHQARYNILQLVNDIAGESTAGSWLISRCPEGLIVQNSLNSFLVIELGMESCFLWELSLPLGIHSFPLVLSLLALGSLSCIVSINLIRYGEWIIGPAQILLGSLQVLLTQWLAVSAGRTLLSRTAITNLSVNSNKGRTSLVCLGFLNSLANSNQISAICYINCLETKGLHTLLNILSKGNISGAFNRNTVAIIDNNQLGQTKSTC